MSWLLGAKAHHPLMLLPPTGGFFLGVNHANESSSNRHHASYRMDGNFIVHESTGGIEMAAFNVGAIVQKKTGGIHGVVDSLQDPDGDHPQFWVRWDDRNYSVHPENELRAATPDGPQFYKSMS